MSAWRTILVLAGIVTLAVPSMAASRVQIAVMGLFHPHQLQLETLPGETLIVTGGGQADGDG